MAYTSFLKWPGQKTRLIPQLLKHLDGGELLVDVFTGSSVIFMATDYDKYILADKDADLMQCYWELKHNAEEFIPLVDYLFNHKKANTEKNYYENRDSYNYSDDPQYKAALLIYLSRHGFNGLIRRSAKSGFNVPFGNLRKIHYPEKELYEYSQKLHRAELRVGSFEDTLKNIEQPFHAVFDPPYCKLNKTSSFNGYVGGFKDDLHTKLSEMAHEIAAKGNRVVICNHDTPQVRSIYRCHHVETHMVQRSISASAKARVRVPEYLGVYNPAVELKKAV